MKSRILALAILLILLTAAPVDARGHGKPHADTAADSISVRATVAFGTSVTGSYVYPETPGPTESLWFKVTCYANGTVGLVGWGKAADGTTQPVGIGPTPSWSGPSADCTAALVVWDSYQDFPERDAASAPFEVQP